MGQTLPMRNPRRSLGFVICCAACLLATACSSDENSSSVSTTSDTLAVPSTTTTTTTTTIVVAPTTAAPTITIPAPTTTLPAPTSTTAAPTTTVAPTTTTLPPGASLSLANDGIGDARFGAEPGEVIAYISGVVGEQNEDSGWVDAISRTCAGTAIRFVRWGDLTLLFGDESSVASGPRHFFAWEFGPAAEIEPAPAGLATPEGISIRSSVVDIGRAYPTATLFEGDELATASAHIDDNLFAFITDTKDSGVITAMLGGQGCGE